jgi:hypothetical protein
VELDILFWRLLIAVQSAAVCFRLWAARIFFFVYSGFPNLQVGVFVSNQLAALSPGAIRDCWLALRCPAAAGGGAV